MMTEQLADAAQGPALEPLLRAMQQTRLRQLRKWSQLQRQTLLDLERSAALAAKQQRAEAQQREQEAQHHAELAARAQHASYVERKRQEAISAGREAEQRAQALLAAKLLQASERAAAVQEQRVARQRTQLGNRAASRQATIQATKTRAEQVAEERRQQYLSKAAAVENKLKALAEERKAAEAARKEEESRKETLRKLHISRAELDEQERRDYFKRRQQVKDQELARRWQDLDGLRTMQAQEAKLKEEYARQRRELAEQREQERRTEAQQRTQQKLARVEALEQRKASLRQALELLQQKIARQEGEFSAALQTMQRSGQYTRSSEVAELQAMLVQNAAWTIPLLTYGSSRTGGAKSYGRPRSWQQPKSGRPAAAQPLSYAATASAKATQALLLTSGSGIVLSSKRQSPAPTSPGGVSGSSVSSPCIPAYRGWAGSLDRQRQHPDMQQGAAELEPPSNCGDGGADAPLFERLALEGPNQPGPGSRAGSPQQYSERCSLDGQHCMSHETYALDACQCEARNQATDPSSATSTDAKAQLQAMLAAEVQAEAERERRMAEAQDASERQWLMRKFMVQREQAKQAVLALAQGLELA